MSVRRGAGAQSRESIRRNILVSLVIVAAGLLYLLLGGRGSVAGTLEAVEREPGRAPVLILTAEDGRRMELLVTETAVGTSLAEGMTWEAFLADPVPGSTVTARGVNPWMAFSLKRPWGAPKELELTALP